MARTNNPDRIIEALEEVCKRFKVTIDCRRFTGDVVIYDNLGAEICSFNGLTVDGPKNLGIGHDYISAYNTEAR